ncbi:MAG: apolipoprotein N-acyltransferase [Phycisphaerae bacterium]|nr:apolipoprotein N-acyltransferase [Phycisphaerae bacterium]
MKKDSAKNLLFAFLAFAFCAGSLTVIQPPFHLSFLAWIALVPFLLVTVSPINTKYLLIASFIASAVYWLGNLYYLVPITIAGWVAFCLYTALLWPLVVIAIRFAYSKGLPIFVTAPIFFVAAERLQGFFLGGLNWRLLAHSQFENLPLIQMADIFGTAGLSLLIALVNALLAEFIIAVRQKHSFGLAAFLKTVFVLAALASAFFYGRWRILQTPDYTTAGPIVAAVQSNVPQSVKESTETGQTENEIFDELIPISNKAAESNPLLIVWPETMVMANLDPRVLNLLGEDHEYKLFDKKLRQHAADSNSYLLIGAYGAQPQVEPDLSIDLVKRYNSAFLYRPDSTKSPRQYDKIHLVPFGEVVPFKKRAPWLYNILMSFTPYDYDYSLSYGKNFTIFDIYTAPSEPPLHFGVMICYEDTVPYIARRFAIAKDGKKQVDFLVNISNDGWFVRFEQKKVLASTELAQHVAACVFRAVENRLAILRSVNTGISCVIDSTGRVVDGYIDGSLPVEALQRNAVAGYFADKMPIDKRITFFSRYGRWLDLICAVFFLIVLIAVPAERFFKKNKKRAK